MKKVTEEFRQEAVRIVLSRGRTIRQVGRTLGLANRRLANGFRGIGRRIFYPARKDVQKELARLRRENEVLRQERDLLKKAAAAFFARETSR